MPPQERHPVVLVHGIWKNRSAFRRMGRHLENQGLSVHPIDLTPSDGSAGIDALAGQLKAFIDGTFPESSPVDLLGFSMGGVVSRYYVQRLGGIERVRRFITISSPHHGTHWARTRDLPGYLHMRPDSPLLRDLNRDVDMLSRINFTSIWTPLDLMILPPESSRLPVGSEVLIAAPLHALMLHDPRSFKAVAAALSAPLKR